MPRISPSNGGRRNLRLADLGIAAFIVLHDRRSNALCARGTKQVKLSTLGELRGVSGFGDKKTRELRERKSRRAARRVKEVRAPARMASQGIAPEPTQRGNCSNERPQLRGDSPNRGRKSEQASKPWGGI